MDGWVKSLNSFLHDTPTQVRYGTAGKQLHDHSRMLATSHQCQVFLVLKVLYVEVVFKPILTRFR